MLTHEKVVLDHGYLALVGTWGSEEAIIEAARMSTGKGFLGWGEEADCALCGGSGTNEHMGQGPGSMCRTCNGMRRRINVAGDEKLLRFLYENHHDTPFEMAGLTIEVKAPIFVFREWHRHRVPFGYNEMSARYTPLPDENYIPSVERLLINSKTNKQAGTVAGADELTEASAQSFRDHLGAIYAAQESLYREALRDGVPKELARVHLPVGRYSRMRATGNLRGWLSFLTLRMAPSAQWEIRQYANALSEIVAEKFPRTWGLFQEKQEKRR